ncbi:MAG: HU family DNA-binding protein [Rhodobacteraceae bacterium]|nr:HU family DNA-binding protein [Paracoccaceae bacterium]
MVTKPKTTTRKTTTRKPAVTTAKATKKPPVQATSATATPVKDVKSAVQAVATPAVPVLRKKQLIDEVVTRSGIKKKFAKPVVEAMLDVLGDAISSGKEMNVQPFGKVMTKKQTDKPNAKVSIVKIRQSKRAKEAAVKPPLMPAAE